MEDRKVVLGGQEFTIGPLTLGDLKKLGMGAAKQRQGSAQSFKIEDDWAKGEGIWFDGTMEVLACALGKTRDEVEKLPGVSLQELLDSSRKIFTISGLIDKSKEGKDKKGEETGATG